jgi:hypothetical protein
LVSGPVFELAQLEELVRERVVEELALALYV